jgi:hypothetical protein
VRSLFSQGGLVFEKEREDLSFPSYAAMMEERSKLSAEQVFRHPELRKKKDVSVLGRGYVLVLRDSSVTKIGQFIC